MENLFEVFGLSSADEQVYRLLVEDHPLTFAAIAKTTKLTRANVERSVAALAERRLVERRGDAVEPVQPSTALEVLFLERRQQLELARAEAQRLAKKFYVAKRDDPRHSIEAVDGLSVTWTFEELQRAAVREIRGFDTPPYGGDPPDAPMIAIPTELELLAAGIRYRIVYDATALDFPGMVTSSLPELLVAGEEARVYSRLPMKLAIADDDVALIAVPAGDEVGETLVIRSAPVVLALSLLFDLVWERSASLHLDTQRRASPDAGENALTAEDRVLLGLLASGLKEAAIARHLGIALRTVGRRTQRLMTLLGAQTRFQAGVIAVERGWIRVGDDDAAASS
jgi:DNA-binding CsgD family transcriptional regulator/DNA-binding Lrp family transcriptional regulator